jgi:lysozyme
VNVTFDHDALDRELARDEGLRLQVYRCTSDKLTIGIGRNLDDVGIHKGETAVLGITKESCIKNGITKHEALVLFSNDVANCCRDLDRRLPWWRTLTDARQRVLVNMCFNMGIARLAKFVNTLAMIEAGKYDAAAKGMLNSLWAKQVGARARRLATMMERG